MVPILQLIHLNIFTKRVYNFLYLDYENILKKQY